jgi:hypothetical protein
MTTTLTPYLRPAGPRWARSRKHHDDEGWRGSEWSEFRARVGAMRTTIDMDAPRQRLTISLLQYEGTPDTQHAGQPLVEVMMSEEQNGYVLTPTEARDLSALLSQAATMIEEATR